MTEQPSGDVTTFGYDDAGRLTSENRTGVRAYTSAYSYDSRGNRQTAARSESGVVSHNGTYSYDDASRLTQVVDTATGQTEPYGWNDDSAPGAGAAERQSTDWSSAIQAGRAMRPAPHVVALRGATARRRNIAPPAASNPFDTPCRLLSHRRGRRRTATHRRREAAGHGTDGTIGAS